MSDPNQTPQRTSTHRPPSTPYVQPPPITPLPSTSLLQHFTPPHVYADRLAQMQARLAQSLPRMDTETHTENKDGGLPTISEVDPASKTVPSSDTEQINTQELSTEHIPIQNSQTVSNPNSNKNNYNNNNNNLDEIQKQFDFYALEMQNKNAALHEQLEQMSQQVAQLQYEAAYHRYHANNNPSGYNIIKNISKPESFSGTGDIKDDPDTWIAQMRNYLLLSGTPPVVQAQVAATYLKGAAAQWYKTLSVVDRGQLTGFEALAAKLLTRFRPLDIIAQARNKLSRLQQTGSVEKFNQEFQKLMSLIPTMNEEERIDSYRRKLKYNLQLQLVTQEYHKLSDIMNVALRTDALLFENHMKTLRNNNNNNTFRKPFDHSKARSVPVNNITAASPETKDPDQNQEPASYAATLNYIAPMTDAERQRCREQRLCFRCRRPGHISTNCPTFTTSKCPSSFKPSVPISKKE